MNWKIALTLSFMFAATSSASEPTTGLCSPSMTAAQCDRLVDAQVAALNASTETQNQQTIRESRQSCDDAVKKYKEHMGARSDFNKACAIVGAGGSTRACFEKAQVCIECVASSEDDENYDTFCEDHDIDEDLDSAGGVNGFIRAVRQARQGQPKVKDPGVEIRNARRMYNACPLYAANDLKQLRDDKKSHKESMEAADEAIADITKDLNEAKIDLQKLQTEYQELPEKYSKEVEKLKNEENEALMDELSKVSDQLAQVILALQAADTALLDAETAIYQECHTRAVQALDARKKDRAAKASQGRLSAGGFRNLANLTDRESELEKFAINIRNSCLSRDGVIRRKLESAKRVYDSQVKQLQLQITRLQQMQQQITDQLMGTMENKRLKDRLESTNERYKAKMKELEEGIQRNSNIVQNLETLLAQAQQKKAESEYEYTVAMGKHEAAKKVTSQASDDVTPGDFVALAGTFKADLDAANTSCQCEDAANQIDQAACTIIKGLLNQAQDSGFDPGTGRTNR